MDKGRCFSQFIGKIFSKHKEEIEKHKHVFLLISVYIVNNMYSKDVTFKIRTKNRLVIYLFHRKTYPK